MMHCQIKYGHPHVAEMLCPIALDDCKVPFYLAYNRFGHRTIPEMDIFVQEVLAKYHAASYI